MRHVTLDQITRSSLLRRGLPIHWYIQFLKQAADCLRELTFDTLQVVNSKLLPVSETGTIKLPCDYVDWVRVGAGCSQILYPLSNYPELKRLPNLDENEFEIPYTVKFGEVYYAADYWWENINIHGEDIGRRFGQKVSAYPNGFMEIRERDIIQLSEAFCGKTVTLEYIGDGSGCDAATRIHPYAQSTIEAYIDWQTSTNRASNFSPEGQRYHRSAERLRGRLNPLSAQDLIDIIEGSRHMAIK